MALLAFVAVAATIAPAASAASPQEICAAIQAGTPGTYSQADIDAYNSALQSDPTIQGYCSPLPPPPPPTCVPGSTSGGTNGTTGTNGTNGTCASTPTPPSPPTPRVVPATAPTAQVLGATKTKTAPAASVAPQKTAAAPLASTKATGTLPFTGAELTIFALVGAGLLLGGLLLRTSARRRDDAA